MDHFEAQSTHRLEQLVAKYSDLVRTEREANLSIEESRLIDDAPIPYSLAELTQPEIAHILTLARIGHEVWCNRMLATQP